MIQVQEIESGDFKVTKGGDVYRRYRGQVLPGTVSQGDTVSAAEICEWIENGIEVEDKAVATKAAFRTFGQHHCGCATNDEFRRSGPGPCDCGFEKVSAAIDIPLSL